jgi:hypothetical protein
VRTAPLIIVLGLFTLSACARKADPAAVAPDTPVESNFAVNAPPADDREKIENPQYLSWARFAPGTVVVLRSVTGDTSSRETTVTTTTTTLIERADAHVVIETQNHTKRYDGVEMNRPPSRFTHARWIAAPPKGSRKGDGKTAAADADSESLMIAGRTYQTRRHKTTDRNEAGAVFVTTWTSEAIPGGLARSILETPAIGKTTRLEVVEIRLPK